MIAISGLILGLGVTQARADYVPPVAFQTSTINVGQTVTVYVNGDINDWQPTEDACIAVGFTDANHNSSNFIKTGFAHWHLGMIGAIGGTKKTLAPVFGDSAYTTTKKLHPLQMTYNALSPKNVNDGFDLVVAYYPYWDCVSGPASSPIIARLTILGPNAKAPAAPTGLKALTVTKTSVTLSWNEVPGATNYQLFLDGQPVYFGSNNPQTDTTKTFNSFSVGSTHSFGVAANNNIGSSVQAKVTVTLQGLDPIPLAVSTANVTDIAYNKATVQWLPVPGADRYSVEISPSASPASEISVTSLQFTGLTGETNYTVSIKSGSDGGFASEKTITFTTAVDPANLPQAPTNLKVTNVSKNSAAFSWNSVDKATSYNVLVNGIKVATGIATTSYNVQNLPSNSKISLAVEGVSDKGIGNRTTFMDFYTQIDPAATLPPGPIVAGGCSLMLDYYQHCSWYAVDRTVSYKIYLDDSLVATVSALTTSYDLYWLSLGSHKFQVEPVNTYGSAGKWTNNLTISRPPSLDNIPIQNFVISNVSDTGAVLTWDAVPGAKGYDISLGNQFGTYATTSTNSVTLNQFKPGRVYVLSVQAFNDTSRTMTPVEAPWINTTGTFVPFPAPSAVTGVLTRGTKTTSTFLEWEPVENATAYSVTLGNDAPITTDMPGMTLSNLSPAREYSVKIRPIGEQSTSAVTQFTFMTAGGSGRVSGTVLATGATKVTWAAAAGAKGYKVYVAGKLVATLGKVLTYTVTTPFGRYDDLIVVKSVNSKNVLSQLGTYSYKSGASVKLGTVAFAVGKSDLTAASKKALDKLATTVESHGFSKASIVVNVQTTKKVSTAQATALAASRADAIKTYLQPKLPWFISIETKTTASTKADSSTLSATWTEFVVGP